MAISAGVPGSSEPAYAVLAALTDVPLGMVPGNDKKGFLPFYIPGCCHHYDCICVVVCSSIF